MSMKYDWELLKTLANEEIEAVLSEMPDSLSHQARQIPLTLEPRPNAALQNDGIEPDTLGIFTGADYVEYGHAVMPPQIILFLNNLWEFSGGDSQTYQEEIRTTFLHELGHYFGLDEEDLIDRGLE